MKFKIFHTYDIIFSDFILLANSIRWNKKGFIFYIFLLNSKDRKENNEIKGKQKLNQT